MEYGNKRKRIRKIANSPLSVIAVFIIFLFAAKAAWNTHEKAEIAADRLDHALSEMAKLEERKDGLVKKVEYLSTEQGQEAEMRTKFRAVREGESVAVIVDETKFAPLPASASQSDEKRGILSKMLRFIGF